MRRFQGLVLVTEDKVMKAFETYASSFQHGLRKDQCPETPSK